MLSAGCLACASVALAAAWKVAFDGNVVKVRYHKGPIVSQALRLGSKAWQAS